MIPDKKKAAMLIIAKAHGGQVEAPDDDYELEMVAEDLLSAVKDIIALSDSGYGKMRARLLRR